MHILVVGVASLADHPFKKLPDMSDQSNWGSVVVVLEDK